MELLAYVLALFGLILLLKGIQPTLKWINTTTEKELIKGTAALLALMTLFFYVYVMVTHLNKF